MRNKLLAFARQYRMVEPGDRVVCAVSGGADSIALLWAMYLLQDKLDICVEAAHFNHHLRGEESRRDAAFVEAFCKAHHIPFHLGEGSVTAGEKGLEAAAREARYAFLCALPGKIATAHTADDNAETVLMHLIRGTGLKGLGGIAPVRENLIRPMLTVTRQEVLAFLEAENIPYVNDSSNDTDAFLRNRIRHHVMPLLKEENPSLSRNLSAAALRLRQDEEALDGLAEPVQDVNALRQMPPAIQTRALKKLLEAFGVKEPEAEHIELLRRVILSDNPSARSFFPGSIVIAREYDALVKPDVREPLSTYPLRCPGSTDIPELGLRVTCEPVGETAAEDGLCLRLYENAVLRGRKEGDTIRLSGGTKTLKKLYIDRKIPASRRECIPVIADSCGVAAVYGIGIDCDRKQAPNWVIRFEVILT